MATRLYGVLLDGLKKPIINATVVLLAKGNTITVLNGSEAIFKTDAQGAYNVTVQSGYYKVIIGPQGIEPYKAGEIAIYADSPEGSLNSYLVNWAEEDLTPEVIKQVKELVAVSEEYALQAGRSASAAQSDATDARNSKASAAQSASDALVYKNDSKANADAAKQAQAGAAGSANTANTALTTIRGIQKDVTASKDRAVTAETNAKSSENVATQAKTDAVTAKNEAVAAKDKAKEYVDSIQPANFVVKSQNLADLADKSASRNNLSAMFEAKTTLSNSQNLDDLKGSAAGFYHQVLSANAKPELNYPIQIAGSLLVQKTGAGHSEGCIQTYYIFNNMAISYRRAYGGQGWSAWKKSVSTERVEEGELTTYVYSNYLPLAPRLQVSTSGLWGCHNGSSWVPLTIAQGGTGATSLDNARTNLGLGRDNSPQLNSLFLDKYSDSTDVGTSSGILRTRLLSTNDDLRLATYMYAQTLSEGKSQLTIRFVYNGSTGDSKYLNLNSEGNLIVDSAILKSTVEKPLQINSANPAIRFNETDRPANTPTYTLIANGGNWFIHKSDYDDAGSTSTAISYNFANDRLDVQNLKASGLITANSGIETLTGRDWNTQHTDNINKFVPIAGSTNGPAGSMVLGGFHAQYNTNYAVQFGGRNSGFWGRTIENGTVQGWKKLLTVDDLNSSTDLSVKSVTTSSPVKFGGGIDSKGGVVLHDVPYPALAFRSSRYTSPNTLGAFTKLEVTGQDGEVAYVTLSRHYGDGSIEGAMFVMFPNTGGTLALQGTSGINYKKNIVDADANEAMDRITGQRLVNFVYKDDEQERVRFGIIAEEAELIAPQYIKHNRLPYEDIIDEDGNKIGEKTRDRPSVDVNPIVMDLMGCVQALNAKIAALEAEIAELKASK